MNNNSVLRHLFGENRREWYPQNFESLFVRPAYMEKLTTNRPCFLVGGRGTGKTTALKSLRFDSRSGGNDTEIDIGQHEYFGIFVRINKNRMQAFQGGAIKEKEWIRIFSHYFNLLACKELCELAGWLFQLYSKEPDSYFLRQISVELGLNQVSNFCDLGREIDFAVSSLQVYVNNPSEKNRPTISMAESPLRAFSEYMEKEKVLNQKAIFCCIDEYENLLEYQQAVLNTYIKHSEPPLSYKIGIRKNGLKTRQTLDGNDLLNKPDDYHEIDIAKEGFEYFAKEVIESRLRYAKENGCDIEVRAEAFLMSLSFSEEAETLGANRHSINIDKELRGKEDRIDIFLDSLPATQKYFLEYWRQKDPGSDLLELANDWIENPEKWNTRIVNHGYSSLFWLSKGNKGVRIRKYYCGWNTFYIMSGGNIRFFLDLIDASIAHQQDEDVDNRIYRLTPKSQTLGARQVGRSRLDQLEDLSDYGVHLKRLVLAIGKVFFEFARSPIGKTPEVTSFVLSGDAADIDKLRTIFIEGEAHLAFEIDKKTKATSVSETKDDEYRLHRIFSAFFEISHRKKRRITFDANEVLGVLGDRPGASIKRIIGGSPDTGIDQLPEQLAFFSSFFEG